MKLYTFPGAPSPLRVDLFVAEKGIVLERELVDLKAGAQFDPAFRRKSPNCDVPVLELDDGLCISQVNAICFYLETRYPSPPLYGDNPESRALVMMWDQLAYINGFQGVSDALRNHSPALAGHALTGPHAYDQIPDLVDRGRLRVGHFFDDMEIRLSESLFVAGDSFSIADISVFTVLRYAGWIKQAPDEGRHPSLCRWYQALSHRPAFQSVLADQ